MVCRAPGVICAENHGQLFTTLLKQHTHGKRTNLYITLHVGTTLELGHGTRCSFPSSPPGSDFIAASIECISLYNAVHCYTS